MQIGVVVPHSLDAGPNCLAWKWATKEMFSVSETYKKLHQFDLGVNAHSWKIIWEVRVPQRVRMFMWTLWHERILTNDERVRRHMTNYRSCERCSHVDESSIHALRDCSFAKAVWLSIVPKHNQVQFFSFSLQD